MGKGKVSLQAVPFHLMSDYKGEGGNKLWDLERGANKLRALLTE